MREKLFQGIPLPMLGMGSLRLPLEEGSKTRIDRPQAKRVLDCALANGINYIDTAYTYNQGDAERFLGEALAGRPRDSYYLTSKFYVAASRDIRAVFEEQLRRCRTEYFDFYLLHSLDENYIEPYMDPQLDYLGYLLEQKKAGRIRYLGFSSHAQTKTLARFLDWYDGFDMAQIQCNYLDWNLLDAKGQYALLEKHGIPIWVMEPLKGGRLAELSPEALAVLREAAPGRSAAAWSFRFLMDLPQIQMVLGGMSSVEQVEENVRTFSETDALSQTEQEALKKAAGVFMEQLGVPCSACRYCCATCPAELDIPELIRCYNEYRVSGETWKVTGLQKLAKGPEQCLACGACTKRCPQKIDIPKVLAQYTALLRKN